MIVLESYKSSCLG